MSSSVGAVPARIFRAMAIMSSYFWMNVLSLTSRLAFSEVSGGGRRHLLEHLIDLLDEAVAESATWGEVAEVTELVDDRIQVRDQVDHHAEVPEELPIPPEAALTVNPHNGDVPSIEVPFGVHHPRDVL